MDDCEGDDSIPLEETLLLCARRGQTMIISDILKSRKEGKIEVDINCKGTNKANRGWTPLHLAAYFGHTDVVKILLQNGADVDVLNNTGDTPLHRAAYTSRVDVVMSLLEEGADVSIKNDEGFLPKQMTKNTEIIRLIEAAEKHEAKKLEEEFMSSVRLGQVDKVEQMVSDGKFSQLNTQDHHGNSALHLAAQSGQKEVAVYLLQKGVNSGVKNNQGLTPCDVARTEQMKQLLSVQPVRSQYKLPQRFEGLLIKKTTFMGKNPFWVVLERGVMSYFRNRGDATTGSKRRGMKYLDEADVMISKENVNEFLIKFSDGAIHKLSIDPAASQYRLGTDPATGEIVTRQRWLNALSDHIGFATHFIHAGDSHEDKDSVPISSIDEALQLAQAHQKVLETQVKHLSNYIDKTHDNSHHGNSRTQYHTHQENSIKLQKELELTVKYSKDMCTSLTKCLAMFTQQDEMRSKQLHEEKEKARVLQEALHALALQHHELERSYSRQNSRARSYSVEDDEFFECDEDEDGKLYFHRPISPEASSVYSDALSFKSCTFDLYMEDEGLQDNANICDSNKGCGVGNADADNNEGCGVSNAGARNCNAGTGDSLVNDVFHEVIEDSTVTDKLSYTGSGDSDTKCEKKCNDQSAKENSKAICDENSDVSSASKANYGERCKEEMKKSRNWQMQLNGRYEINC